MICTANPQVGAAGVTITLTVTEKCVPADLSAAAYMAFIFRRPSGSSFVRSVTLETDGKDGKLIYTTEAGDLDEAGEWQVQARVTLGGFDGPTEVVKFLVDANAA